MVMHVPGRPAPVRLAPGVHAVARGRSHLQVGLLGTPLVLPREPEVEQALDALTEGRTPRTPVAKDLAQRLTRRGLAERVEDPVGRVEVIGGLGTDPQALLSAYDWQGERRIGLLLHPGEVTRDLLDGWLRDRVPHLVVRSIDGRAVIGPYVVPGVTACLRCLDEYALEVDAESPSVRERYADAAAPHLDPALAQLVTAWAVREVVTAALDRRPTSWSTTCEIDTSLQIGRRQVWRRHPQCGCGW